jgi:ribosomal-protein-alanine N-acetyltransferase
MTAGAVNVPNTYDLIPDAVPVLRGNGLVLRAMAEVDLAPWFSRLSDAEAARLAGDPVATSMQAVIDGLAYHRATLRDKRAIRWAIVPDSSAVSIGSIGLVSFNAAERSCEVGAAIGRALWNQGTATRAGELVIDYARSTLRLRRIDAIVLAHNARVIRVLDKLGFVRAGDVPPDHEIRGSGHPSLWFCRHLIAAGDKEET